MWNMEIRNESTSTSVINRTSKFFFASVFLFIFSLCLKRVLLLTPHVSSMWHIHNWHKNSLHEIQCSPWPWSRRVHHPLFVLSPPDSEPVDASGGHELWEAEDGVGAVGAAHQEVCQLAAVADAHPGLLHLHQHDPLHQNLPQTPMMNVSQSWTL